MIYLDLFSGYGGFHKGLEEAGFEFEQVYISEIDKHAIANYSYNYPNSIYAGPIQSVNRATVPRADIITFGWPCQDNSIAGKRKGQLQGTRSGLLYEATRCISEYQPRHFIAENVTGLLSVSKGVDYIEAIRVLAYLNEACQQYDVEMQLCNTRWLLPQNRERLFFIGHLRNSGSRQIFPIEPVSKEAVKGADINVIANTNMSGETFYNDYAGTIRANASSNYQLVNNIRRLTPIECERLQGLPDNWTKHGKYNERPTRADLIFREQNPELWAYHTKMSGDDILLREVSDTQRYRLCGNGVSVPIVKMIAQILYALNY